MSIIAKSIQTAHILGVLIISIFFLYNLSVKSESVQADKENEKSGDTGALSVVITNGNNNADDGEITVEENGSDFEEIDENLEEFQPTNEWKEVMKGQKVPAGLHIRMNMQTGKKEAKLIDEDPTKNVEQWDAGENIGIINTEKKRFTRDELKAALKDFKYKDEAPNDKEHKKNLKNKFRSYDELKKEMKELNLSVKTEAEIVTELEAELQQADISVDRLKIVLTDLEYYLHQIDNARIFCDLGGLKSLIRLMNSTDEDIRETATFVLGAAVQSNSKVQVAAVDSGLLQQLLKMLSVDPSLLVRKKVVFALSALLRQFPFAQKKFLHLGGLSGLANLFVECKSESLQIRIVTLLTDLLQEYDFNVNQVVADSSHQAERTKQYKEVQLRENLSQNGWCSLLTSLLHAPSGPDSVEKIVSAMLALVDICRSEFSPARPRLQALMLEYQLLAQQENREDSDDFYSHIYSTIQVLVKETHKEDL